MATPTYYKKKYEELSAIIHDLHIAIIPEIREECPERSVLEISSFLLETNAKVVRTAQFLIHNSKQFKGGVGG